MSEDYKTNLANMSGDNFSRSIQDLKAAAQMSGTATPTYHQSGRPVRNAARKLAATGAASPAPSTPTTLPATTSQPQQQQSSYYPQHYYNNSPATSTFQSAYQPPAPTAQPAVVAPPLPPPNLPPVPTVPQARLTSYPSRMRTGATLLMQPILTPNNAPAAATAAALGLGARSGRSRAAVNYAEAASADEFDDDSDDEDFSASKREAARKAKANAMAAAAAAVSNELDQSYLGKIPLSKFISTKVAHPARHNYQYREVMEKAAEKKELLVPIRVEVDTDTHRIRDVFTWNLNEDLITPQHFAQMFCHDLDLPSAHVETIVNMIRAQLDEHSGVVSMNVSNDDDPDSTAEDADCRVILRLDVQLDNYHLVDHIEWDLCSSPATPESTPEAFAKQLCADLGLRGEAVSIISHALHEEIIKHKKDAVEWGVLGGIGGVPEDGGYRRNQRGPRRLRGVWRDWLEFRDYGPRMEILTPEELERKEMERERASRRMRRETTKFQRSALASYRDTRPPRPSRLR